MLADGHTVQGIEQAFGKAAAGEHGRIPFGVFGGIEEHGDAM